ncbi:MAG: M23 family metallopeptidase [Sphingomonadales bacterium]|nr:M23 family metallopeptidase [Sphingomonadales bacterium]
MVAAIAGLSLANPALANSSANADVNAPIRAAQAAKAPQGGDDEFRRLFTGWKTMDNGQLAIAPAATTAPIPAAPGFVTPNLAVGTTAFAPRKVSIPSRNPLNNAALTSNFGMRTHPVLGGRRAHKGIDLAAPTGTPVYASADGVISKAEWFSSYGLYIAIEHGGEIQTRYGHLSRLNVAAGQPVKKGDLIGYVGSTGRSTGPHLHYEVRIAGTAVNPVPYMNGIGELATSDVAMGGGEED